MSDHSTERSGGVTFSVVVCPRFSEMITFWGLRGSSCFQVWMLTHVLHFRATERKGGDGGWGLGSMVGTCRGFWGAEREGRRTPARFVFWMQAFWCSRLMQLDETVSKSCLDGTLLLFFSPLLSLFYFEIFGTHTVTTRGGKISKGYFCLVCKDQWNESNKLRRGWGCT